MSTTRTKCYLCSAEGEYADYWTVAGPVLGPAIDLSISSDWFCPSCFRTYQHSEPLRKRILQTQDEACRQAREMLTRVSRSQLSGMTHLPEGLRVVEADCERLTAVSDRIHDLHAMQDEQDLKVCFRVYRNLTQAAYFIGAELVDYDDLTRRFEQL